MKTSFYFVLWQLVWLLAILLDIPFLNKYGLFFAFIVVFFIGCIIKKLLKNQIEYQQMFEQALIMEMAYNNDYKRYKRQSFLYMLIQTAIFGYMLMTFIALFTVYSDVLLIDYILWGILTILSGLSSLWYIKSYMSKRKVGQIILDHDLQGAYQSYASERAVHSFEEILQPQPKHYQAMCIMNYLFAMFCITIGLLTIIIFYSYRNDIILGSGIVQVSMVIYGLLAVYFGVKDLLDTLNSQKYLFLLLSCAIVPLLYMPIIHYIDRKSLATYIVNDSNLSYDTKKNLIQYTIILDEINDSETTWLKQRTMLLLSGSNVKKLLERIIKVDAEMQIIFRDESGNKQIVTILPSELKELYNQTKSDLDILLAEIKLDYGVGTKIYDDGTYIVIELFNHENDSYPVQSEQTHFSTLLSGIIKNIAECYDITYFNRGLKIRLFFANHQFIEQTLSLEELKMKERDTGTEYIKKESSTLFNIFSTASVGNNE
jgi:hypothetical protein